MAAITPWGFDPDALAATYGRTPSLPDTLRLASQDWGICPETIRLILAHSALETTQDGLEGCPATGRVSIPRSTASLKMKLSGREGGPRHGRHLDYRGAGSSALRGCAQQGRTTESTNFGIARFDLWSIQVRPYEMGGIRTRWMAHPASIGAFAGCGKPVLLGIMDRTGVHNAAGRGDLTNDRETGIGRRRHPGKAGMEDQLYTVNDVVSGGIRLQIEFQPRANYSLALSGIPFIRALVVHNESGIELPSIQLKGRLAIAGHTNPVAWSREISGPHAPNSVTRIDRPVDFAEFLPILSEAVESSAARLEFRARPPALP